MYRLEGVAADQWHWRLIDEPIIKPEQKIVIVKGEIALVNAVRHGIGVAKLDKVEASSIKTAVMTAESEAFRDACDKFMMGWKDLAPYRDWASNPGISLTSNSITQQPVHGIQDFNETVHSVMPPSNRTCIRCKNQLSSEEELFLSMNRIKFAYCREHVPKQLIKNHNFRNKFEYLKEGILHV